MRAFNTKLKTIGIFEIFVLILSSVSFSFIIGGFDSEIVSALSLSDVEDMVSTSTEGKCCLETTDGNACQNIDADVCDSQCEGSCLPSSCEGLSQCSVGCCYDSEEGSCSPNSMQGDCEAQGGEWSGDAFCNLAECSKGCCTLGLNAQWLTRRACEKQAELFGVPFEFSTAISSELECVRELSSSKEGACVFSVGDENNCKFTTYEDCKSTSGAFYEGFLCSNEELDTICERQASVGCFDGKDEIYWFDSCGNRENIYSSDRDASWNNGKVLSKSESCNPGSANADSTNCGNCDYNAGSICRAYDENADSRKVEDGDFVCRDLNCDNAPATVDYLGNVLTRRNRVNGESWCVYDGPIGGIDFMPLPSLDLIGSRHWKYTCDNGEVKVEGCGDYRKEICVESVDDGKASATCRVNMWEQCLGYNGGLMGGVGELMGDEAEVDCGADCVAQCLMNPDCRVHPIVIGEYHNALCVPKYPPGFESGGLSDITGGLGQLAGFAGLGDFAGLGEVGGMVEGLGGGTSAGSVCSLGTQTCTSVWEKRCYSLVPPIIKWECIKNCECHEDTFTMQMNNLCASLGDCGVYANIAGNPAFLGAQVSKKGKHGKTPIQPAVLGITYMALRFIPAIVPADGGFFNENSDILDLGNQGLSDPFMGGGGFGAGLNNVGELRDGCGAGTYALGGGAGLFVGQTLMNSAFGGGMFFGGGGAIFGFDPISIGVAIAVVAAMKLLECGKQEKVEITFTCSQSSGAILGNCEDCNANPDLKPCSKYRCESLGKNCVLINENTGEDKCVTVDLGEGVPTISPLEGVLSDSYSYQDVSSNGFRIRTTNGECIDAFTPLIFGVKTNIYATCRWDVEPLEFEEMSRSFVGGDSLKMNHTMNASIPSYDSLVDDMIGEDDGSQEYADAYNEIQEALMNGEGDLNIYVKCANVDGESNAQDFKINICVNPGPDLTAPIVSATAPPVDTILPYSATEQEIGIFVTEPAECRWGTVNPMKSDADAYDSLENEMECNSDLNDGTVFGWGCKATVPITSTNNKYYILCKDQPWLADDDRNIGADPIDGGVFEYTLMKSKSELQITSIEPSGKIVKGTEPATVELEVGTSGGGYDGLATCAFSTDKENYILFNYDGSTLSTKHTQIFNQMTKGSHTYYVRCADDSGNIAEGETTFNLELDTKEPIITRVFNKGSSLAVLVDEDGNCYYGDDVKVGCGFKIDDGNLMGKNELEHTAPWVDGKEYYIKCKDIWGNQPDSCSMIVKVQDSQIIYK